ncbi:CorA family divalent cation transporter [Acinetobacter baumannii]
MEVKEYASFEYEKVRYLQNAVTNIMNIKQNQIVKVFTIITAVFLSLTLVGTFYGMDFDVMPELSWEHGFFILYDTYFSSSDNTFSIY